MSEHVLACRPSRLAVAIMLACGLSAQASAASFSLGELEGQFDSTLTFGSSWALRNPDSDYLNSASVDDGKRNFKRGDAFSTIFKGIHDLQLTYANSGAFIRGNYWYDFELKDNDQRFKNVSDDGRKMQARASGYQLLDAFVYHNFSIGEQPGTVRLGRQVLNWGESTFIQNGINVINPIDVSAFRRPGAEIKEGLMPVNLVYLSQALTDNLSAKLFYQLDWEQTVIDNCGTFFSANDVVANGCGPLHVGPRMLNNDPAAMAALSPFGISLEDEGIAVQRGRDQKARDDGQWGVGFNWYVPTVNTELGAYFINYHSRQPYINATTSPNIADLNFAPQLCGNLGIPLAGCGGFLGSPAGQQLVQSYRLGTSRYFIGYPEDVRLFGLSFATTLPSGTALSGEVSYRPNLPVQINPFDIIIAGVGVPALSPLLSSGFYGLDNDTDVKGYKRKEVTQAQVTATHFLDRVMGADRLTLVGEVGVTYIGGLEGKGDIRYGRSTAFGQGALYPDNTLCTQGTNVLSPENCNNKGFATSTSWGYRARAVWEYSNWFPGLEARPSIAWSHDVKGYGPEPGFNEGSKAVSLGLDLWYLNTYNLNLSMTEFFGGDYNLMTDRDFVSVSVGVTF